MSKEDWIRKISSRKFWAMLAALVVCICAFFAMPDADVARITALIGAFGDLAIYMLSEALVDAGVPFELHVFPEGPHGISLATRRTSGGKPELENKTDAQWIDLCTDWLGRTFGES